MIMKNRLDITLTFYDNDVNHLNDFQDVLVLDKDNKYHIGYLITDEHTGSREWRTKDNNTLHNSDIIAFAFLPHVRDDQFIESHMVENYLMNNYYDLKEAGLYNYFFEFVLDLILGITTYDTNYAYDYMQDFCNVCHRILDTTKSAWEVHIENRNDKKAYYTYMTVIQTFIRKNWVNWGTDVEHCWFNDISIEDANNENCLFIYCGACVPFTVENLKTVLRLVEDSLAEYERGEYRDDRITDMV